MTSQFVARVSVVLMFVATAAAPAAAQTSLGHGQHISRYGSGYVGNAPNSTPVTSYYRSPTISAYGPATYAQPTTSFYPPSGVAPAAYSPGVSYRVGTPNAAAYNSAYSPIVTPTTPYAANWQYPPQTVMPTVANYAPAPPAYTTNYANVPVTYYRPVTVLSPTGVQQTVLQPCTGSECQAQRRHAGFFGWLFHQNQQAPPTTTGYACAGGQCGQPAAVSVPYYTPGPAAVGTPLGTSSTSIPANVAPSLSGPPVVGGSSTIVPNTSISPGTVVPPSQFGSGAARADYPPADAYCPPTTTNYPPPPSAISPPPTSVSPPTTSFPPNVSAPAPAGELRSVSPGTPQSQGSEPADTTPSLNGPSNAPVGNGVLPESGARPPFRPSFPVETQQPPAAIRRDNNITPIPDPEFTNGTRAKVNKAPQLLKPTRDRTAQAAPSEARLAAFEQESPAPKAAAPAQRKVLGDDIWRSAK